MEDLISYSFQVAKGMEFLSSRKVGTQFYSHLQHPGSMGEGGGGHVTLMTCKILKEGKDRREIQTGNLKARRAAA